MVIESEIANVWYLREQCEKECYEGVRALKRLLMQILELEGSEEGMMRMNTVNSAKKEGKSGEAYQAILLVRGKKFGDLNLRTAK